MIPCVKYTFPTLEFYKSSDFVNLKNTYLFHLFIILVLDKFVVKLCIVFIFSYSIIIKTIKKIE